MNSLETLPDIPISSEGIVSQKFLELEILTFHQACNWIEDYDFVVRVKPDLSKQEKEDCYLIYLQEYYAIAPELANISTDKIFQLLQDCDYEVAAKRSRLAISLFFIIYINNLSNDRY